MGGGIYFLNYFQKNRPRRHPVYLRSKNEREQVQENIKKPGMRFALVSK